MQTTDPRAAGFNAADFRDAIRFAMNMGAPNDPSLQVTFVFDERATFAAADPDAHPYDWTATPTADTPVRQVVVPAAVEWSLGTVADNPVGEFDTSRVVLTVLDTDYAQVQGANEVLIGGVHYVIDTVGPPLGLFDVTVYQLHLTARG